MLVVQHMQKDREAVVASSFKEDMSVCTISSIESGANDDEIRRVLVCYGHQHVAEGC